MDAEYRLMSLEEIICGKKDGFPGLINFVQAYLDVIKCDAKTRELMNRYMKLIGDRASGKLLTTATWLREVGFQMPLSSCLRCPFLDRPEDHTVNGVCLPLFGCTVCDAAP